MIASSPMLPMWLEARTISATAGPETRYRNKVQQPSSTRMLCARRRRDMKRFDLRSAMTRSAPDGRGLDDGDDCGDDGEQTDLGWRRAHGQSSQRRESSQMTSSLKHVLHANASAGKDDGTLLVPHQIHYHIRPTGDRLRRCHRRRSWNHVGRQQGHKEARGRRDPLWFS